MLARDCDGSGVWVGVKGRICRSERGSDDVGGRKVGRKAEGKVDRCSG